MREILFRGKTPVTGEWVEGNLIQITEPLIRCEIKLQSPDESVYLVDPETVGQYIGITDKNGKKIFENDIIKDSETGEIFKIFYNWDRFSKTNDSHYFLDLSLRIYECEVIGNIYDNPELLK